ncbi:MAG TPA: VirB3 family type IV secretion system protein [Hyphomonadaceae bacterium]|nr:VirB3 family type IV secretion system protein [Hyphomonadaceae bacterium]
MAGHPLDGFEIALHSSLAEPITIAGVPRTIAILNATLTAVLALGLQLPWLGVPIGLAVHGACYWLNKRDPYFFEALKRHLRQRPYWDA